MFLSALCIHLDNGRCVYVCECACGGVDVGLDRTLINDHVNMGRIQYTVKKEKHRQMNFQKGTCLAHRAKGSFSITCSLSVHFSLDATSPYYVG